jgi:[acyl-carrier-protein] S-malonyltransferase
MTLAYVMDGGMNDSPGLGVDLYERFSLIRRLYGEVAEWTGVDTDRLLRWELPLLREYRYAGAIRQAAVALGVCDLLAERGIRPDIIAGVSLGGMIGACVAGAVDRHDLFTVLRHMKDAPQPTGPPQAAAALAAPVDMEVEHYVGGLPAGVHYAVEAGLESTGERRMFVLTGYRTALEALAQRLPEGALRLLPGWDVAIHSPLSDYLTDFVKPCIDNITLRNPAVPLFGAHAPKPLTTAAEVRDAFLHNSVSRISYPMLFANLVEQGTDLAILTGPGGANGLPVPVVQVEGCDDIAGALTAVYEFGLYRNPSAVEKDAKP